MRGMNSNTVDLIYLDPPFSKNRKFQQPMNGKIQTELMEYMEYHVKSNDKDFYDEWHRYIYGYIDEKGTAHPAHLVKGRIVSEFDDAFSFSKTKREQLEDLQTAHSDVFDLITAIPQNDIKGYLVFMAIRLIEMERILKNTGSLYLHCDLSANSYIRIILDMIFGGENLRNEIIWFYPSMSAAKNHFPRKTDTILFYTKSKKYTFNGDDVREPYDEKTVLRYQNKVVFPGGYEAKKNENGRLPYNVWQIPPIRNVSKEKIGYPTQKPIVLLERIIRVSSNENDIVFDPFAGCATALEAAFKNNRQWVGADISFMSAVLLRFRIWRIGDLEHDQFCPYRESSNIPPTRNDIVRKKEYYSTQEIAKRVPVRKWYGEKLYVEQHGLCKRCREHEKYKAMDVDHIKPLSKGGTNDLDNLQLLCRRCNAKKSNKFGTLL